MISKFLPSGFINQWHLVSCLKKVLPGPRKLLKLSRETLEAPFHMAAAIPKTFYKYRAFDSRTVESLCLDLLYYAKPTELNDPLECSPILETDSSVTELRNLLNKLIQRRVVSETIGYLKKALIKGAKADAHASKLATNASNRTLLEITYQATDPEVHSGTVEEAESWLLTRHIQDEMLQHYDKGVCSLSTVYNSPLLWSHYGDQHKGICIGYDLDRQPKPLPLKVIYGGSRTIKTSAVIKAIIDGDQSARESLNHDVLLRKAPGWSYEKEWRLVDSPGLHESCLRLRDVTFGLKCPSSVKHAVISALHRHHYPVKFYDMCEDDRAYRLSRSMTDIDELKVGLPKRAMSGFEMFGETI